MSFVKEASELILREIHEIIDETSEQQIQMFIDMILEAKGSKILIIGSGRSGFVGRCFAMRLMHLGFNVYVSEETIAPTILPADLVIAVSGSGMTSTVVSQAEVVKKIGARLLAVTSHEDSRLVELADRAVFIKGRTKIDTDVDFLKLQITGEYTLAPMGTLFELSTMVFLDCIIACLIKELHKKEVDLKERHVNT